MLGGRLLVEVSVDSDHAAATRPVDRGGIEGVADQRLRRAARIRNLPLHGERRLGPGHEDGLSCAVDQACPVCGHDGDQSADAAATIAMTARADGRTTAL